MGNLILKLKGLWWVITAQKRFRVYYPVLDKYSVLVTYMEADFLSHAYGGTICIDGNKLNNTK